MNARAEKFEKQCFDFAVKIVKLANVLSDEKHEWVMSRQIAKSGTSIGANYREAQYAQTKADFVAKVCISLKEAGETQYWIDLLQATGYISEEEHKTLRNSCDAILSSLVRIVKSAKSKPEQ